MRHLSTSDAAYTQPAKEQAARQPKYWFARLDKSLFTYVKYLYIFFIEATTLPFNCRLKYPIIRSGNAMGGGGALINVTWPTHFCTVLPLHSVPSVVEQKFQFHARFVTKSHLMAHLANGRTGQTPTPRRAALGQFNVSVAQMSPGWLVYSLRVYRVYWTMRYACIFYMLTYNIARWVLY